MKTCIEPHMRSSLAGHVLTPLVRDEAAGIEVWRMARPGTRTMSVQIAGTPEGICLMGDLHPGPHHNGCCSVFGLDLHWFSLEISEDYLCSKFLPLTWVPAYAAAALEDWASSPSGHGLAGDKVEEIMDLADFMRGHGCDERQFHEALADLGVRGVDPEYGYRHEDAGWLCAIQERFSALYRTSRLVKSGTDRIAAEHCIMLETQLDGEPGMGWAHIPRCIGAATYGPDGCTCPSLERQIRALERELSAARKSAVWLQFQLGDAKEEGRRNRALWRMLRRDEPDVWARLQRLSSSDDDGRTDDEISRHCICGVDGIDWAPTCPVHPAEDE